MFPLPKFRIDLAAPAEPDDAHVPGVLALLVIAVVLVTIWILAGGPIG